MRSNSILPVAQIVIEIEKKRRWWSSEPGLSERKEDQNRNQSGRNTISPEKQLLMTIWTLATPDSNRSICDRFDVGKATGWRSVKRVVNALINLRNYYIKWPTEEEAMECATFLEEKKGFPGIIGMIDGTHIKIEAPQENHESYINRKGYHSIQLQIVCNHKMEFIHCYVGYPGSVHDQRVFNVSMLQDFCSDPIKFPRDTHLIGDAAYKIFKTLLVPYKDNGRLTERQKNYNYCLSSIRMTVERSIALLKTRFRILLDKLPMRRIDLIPDYIMACCVLHNICLMKNDMIEIPIIVEDQIQNNINDLELNTLLHRQGKEKRDRIKNTLHMRM
ncbi:putative nuclease HARBI1 [Mycetomoellerius zeteki]|uniref:putative nuclease HARBI1 n=1 Tax=Mycetomoellerius zeteki TaxID=64791 RepID=UPI00084E95B2|nr:PREDICTED: putative nuclease HARBI1 [Trachymyrmex zeteki]